MNNPYSIESWDLGHESPSHLTIETTTTPKPRPSGSGLPYVRSGPPMAASYNVIKLVYHDP